ncbi:MAG: acyl-CoA reductase, partial [Myxococcota bacterium]|nr:acyl-CoA reductase [Myxococcota bacterium]
RLLDLAELTRGPGHRLLEATVAMGFSEPVARAGLGAELEAWTAPGALAAVLEELPDDLSPARRPRRVLVIGARTLPVSVMRAVLMARLLGAEVRLKPASGPSLGIAQALAAADPKVTVTPFSSEDIGARDAAIAAADTVVVLGSDETVANLRAAVPTDKGYVGYGHKLSVAWLERTDRSALRGLALDLCAWDQAGCLSPQVAWVAGDPVEVAARLAEALVEVERDLPMALSAAAAGARTTARTYAEMVGLGVETATALIGALPSAAFRPSPGGRCLWLLPAERSALDPIAGALSTVGISGGPPASLPEGVRVCPVGEMQRPGLCWPHDGRPNLTPMLRP